MFKPTTTDPGIVTFSTATYRLLLRFYPSHFRREYTSHMAQVFRDCCIKTYRQTGPSGMFSLWMLTLFDWFKTVIEENLNRETEMNRQKFIRLSGWGMMLAAVIMTLSLNLEPDAIQIGLYRLIGPPVTAKTYNAYRTFSESISDWLLFTAIFLLVIGLVGLRLRYGTKVSTLANHCLLVSIFSGAFIVLVMIGESIIQEAYRWPVFWLGIVVMFSGLTGFGISALRTKPLARWNALPILAGMWIPLLSLIEILVQWFTGVSPESWGGGTDIFFFVTFASLLMLGFVLQSNVPIGPVEVQINTHQN